MVYQKMQELLSEFTVEPITAANLSDYEAVFYNNKKYYYLTDGRPATKEICEASIAGYESYDVFMKLIAVVVMALKIRHCNMIRTYKNEAGNV